MFNAAGEQIANSGNAPGTAEHVEFPATRRLGDLHGASHRLRRRWCYEKGFPLYSYADGCIGACVPNGLNSYSEKANIARQRGGKSLYAAFDTAVGGPKQVRLAGRRDDTGSFLRWRGPDNGGAAISAYQVFRSTGADGSYTQIGSTGGKPTCNDRSADVNVERYFYKVKAVSALGWLLLLPLAALGLRRRRYG